MSSTVIATLTGPLSLSAAIESGPAKTAPLSEIAAIRNRDRNFTGTALLDLNPGLRQVPSAHVVRAVEIERVREDRQRHQRYQSNCHERRRSLSSHKHRNPRWKIRTGRTPIFLPASLR